MNELMVVQDLVEKAIESLHHAWGDILQWIKAAAQFFESLVTKIVYIAYKLGMLECLPRRCRALYVADKYMSLAEQWQMMGAQP